jgi:ABC-type multidrug transport system fused ATPase/permease subunit
MGPLVRFLFRNMKGLRALVALAAIITVLQVSCDIAAAFPLKFIPSKVQNPGNDPACLFPFLNPIESWFDIPQIDPTLQPDPHFAPGFPVEAQCPINPNDPRGRIVLVRHTTLGVIVFSLLMLIIFGLLSALLAFIDLYLAAYIGQLLTARLRNRLFDHLQRLSLIWHGKQQKGDLVQRVTGNIADIQKLVTDGLVDLLAGVLTLVGVVTVMLFLSVPYTLIALAMGPALFVMVMAYTRNIKAATKTAAKATGQIAYVATEDINALTLIKVFTREKLEARRFGTYVDKNKRAGLRAGWLQAQFTPLVSLLVILGTATVIGVGGYVASGYAFDFGPLYIDPYSVDVGTLILFLTFLKLLYQPMRDLSKLATLASTAASGAERVQEVLDQAPEVKESALPGPYSGPQRFQGEITFENVVMEYVPDVPVLQGITLHIGAGKKIGLVGLSGGGKTTLVSLIPRFYDIQQGTIKIDGVDSLLYPLDVLRNNVSMVLQDSLLFEGTIAENIAFGRPGAPIEDIVEAAKKAQIHETITGLPDGYETLVSEQGSNFSGGQRQRLAIARAILRDAPILILDEPTTSLDVEAEIEVLKALHTLMAGRTVLTISHRLSTLGHVDEIVMMSEGRIAEQGTFHELKRRGELFAALLEEQNRYNLDRSEDDSMFRQAVAPLGADTEQVNTVTVPSLPAISVEKVAALNGGDSSHTQSGRVLTATLSKHGSAPSQEDTDKDDGGDTGGEPTLEVRIPPHKAKTRQEYREGRISVEIDGKVTKAYRLNRPVFTIGRFPTSDIQIASPRISRLHAIIRWRNGAWMIEDAESLNGLTCQEQRIDQLALVDGDRIYIDQTIVLHYEELGP